MTDNDKLQAAMAGATAALEGRTMGANPYPEDDDRHFLWLEHWAGARLEMRRPRKEGK